jgi:hypothetical protein
MNDRQRSKYDSHLAVRALCALDTSLALTSSIPAWTPLNDRFLAKISYVDACVLLQNSDTTGITGAKNGARTILIASILETGGALCSLAFLREDPVLEAKADLLPSDINALPDALVDDKATELLELARAIPAPAPGSTQPGLADVGLTPGKLDLLETRIETYNLLLGTPRSARGTKTAATENLQATMEEIDRLLEKGLDKLALQFAGTPFHQQYLLARDPIAVARSKAAVPLAPTP